MQFQAATLLFYCCSARTLIFSHLAGMSRDLLPTDRQFDEKGLNSGVQREEGILNEQERQWLHRNTSHQINSLNEIEQACCFKRFVLWQPQIFKAWSMMFVISPSLIFTSRSCRKEVKTDEDSLSSHPMRQRPAFVGILNDFENLDMLALNEEAWGNTSETPTNTQAMCNREVRGKLLSYSPVPSVLLQELHCCCYSCSRILLWPTFTCTSCLHFQSGQTVQCPKGTSEQQPRCVRQENAMLEN